MSDLGALVNTIEALARPYLERYALPSLGVCAPGLVNPHIGFVGHTANVPALIDVAFDRRPRLVPRQALQCRHDLPTCPPLDTPPSPLWRVEFCDGLILMIWPSAHAGRISHEGAQQ